MRVTLPLINGAVFAVPNPVVDPAFTPQCFVNFLPGPDFKGVEKHHDDERHKFHFVGHPTHAGVYTNLPTARIGGYGCVGNTSSTHFQVQDLANAIHEWCQQTHKHPPGSPFPHLKGVFSGPTVSPSAFITYEAPATSLSTNKRDRKGRKKQPPLESISGHNHRGRKRQKTRSRPQAVYDGGDVDELFDDENDEDYDDGDKSDGSDDGDKSDGSDDGDKSDGSYDEYCSKGAKKTCKQCEALQGASPAASAHIPASAGSVLANHALEGTNVAASANVVAFARANHALEGTNAAASANVAAFEGAHEGVEPRPFAMFPMPGLRAASFSFPVPGLRPGMRPAPFSAPVVPPAPPV